MALADLERFDPPDRASWRAWLEANHASSRGLWLIYHKKGSDCPTVGYDEAVEEALCFGWIDSTLHRLDDVHNEQLFTPRKPKSTWSLSNKARVERLIAEGRMTPAGTAAVEIARTNGSWEMLESIDRLEVPDDLAAALAENPEAARHWEAFSDSVKKGGLYWIASAKRTQTRADRIERVVQAAAEGKRAWVEE